MRNLALIAPASAMFLVAGCAHMPDVSTKYYLPKSSVTLHAIRTLTCNADKQIISATSVDADVVHGADPSTAKDFHFKGIDAVGAELDVTLVRHDDGRLKSINTSATGQGESILKSVTTVAGAVAVAAIESKGDRDATPKSSLECGYIEKWGGGKPLTLTYSLDLALPDTSPTQRLRQRLKADPASHSYEKALHWLLGDVCAVVTALPPPAKPAVNATDIEGETLHLREPGSVAIDVLGSAETSCADKMEMANADPKGATPMQAHRACSIDTVTTLFGGDGTPFAIGVCLWADEVPIAQYGTPYEIHIPRGRFFGKQQFAMSLSESGSLTSLQYANSGGASQVATSIAGIAAFETDATTKAVNKLKAKADLIAAQQRLVLCEANRESCGK